MMTRALGSETKAPELAVGHCAGGLLLGSVGPVCLALWQTKPTRELVAIQRAYLARAVAHDPGHVAFVCAVAASAHAPDEAERAASAAMINEHGAKLAAVACVIEGSGFRAAITRTVLSGIVFVVRSPSPIRLFESVTAATPWLARQLGRADIAHFPAQFELARACLSGAAS
jgi:hypothetical protein